jgi:cytochrome P450
MSLAAIEVERPVLAGERRSRPSGWLQRRREPFAGIPAQAYERPFHRQRTPIGRFVWLNDPAGIKHVLVDNVANYPKTEIERRFLVAVFGDGLLTSNGETWRAHRKIMAPSFDPRSVASYAPIMAREAQAFRAHWDTAPEGSIVDIAKDMTGLTLKIIAQTMFSSDSEELAALIDDAVRRAQAALDVSLLDLAPFVSLLRSRSRERTMRRIFSGLDAALGRLIGEREANLDGAPADLLTRLIAAKDADTGARMTAREVRDQVVTIFLAGHETTAAAMTWVWYLLSQHPAQDARLHAELDQVLVGRAPGPEDVARLPYTRMVIEEAMRLYPPAPGVSNRQAMADDVVEGQAVRAGEIMLISSWLTHRNPKFWPDPERFDPERFSPERSAGRPRYAYLPFGAGPRVCIGAALSMTETMLILATLAQRYRLALAPGETVQLQQIVTLRPRGGLKMVLNRR